MKQFSLLLFCLTLVSSFFLFSTSNAYAASYRDSCLGKYDIDFTSGALEDKYRIDTSAVSFSVGGPNFVSGKTYELYLAYESGGTNPVDLIDSQVATGGVVNFTLQGPNAFSYPNDGAFYNRQNKVLYIGESGERFCTLKKYSVESVASCTFSFDQKGVENTACIDEDGGEVTVRVSDISSPTGIYSGRVTLQVYYGASILGVNGYSSAYDISTSAPGYLEQSFPVYEDRDFWITAGVPSVGLCGTRNKINVVQTCSDEAREEGEGFGETFDPDKEVEVTPFQLCDQITDKDLRGECETCAGDLQDAAGVWTAVGCIKREPTALISSLIQIGLSVAGGVTLLVILSAGFMLTTSQGDPKKAGEAKEMITAAVIGILFIIFSVTILQFIGYNILKIPGFGG